MKTLQILVQEGVTQTSYQKVVRRTNMVTEQRRIAEAKRHRAHKQIRRGSKAFKGSILHSKTR